MRPLKSSSPRLRALRNEAQGLIRRAVGMTKPSSIEGYSGEAGILHQLAEVELGFVHNKLIENSAGSVNTIESRT